MELSQEIELRAMLKLAGVVATAPVIAETLAGGEGEAPTSPGEMVTQLVTPTDIGMTGAAMVGAPYLMGKYKLFGATPVSLGEAASSGLGVASFPVMGLGNLMSWASGPLRDPKYQKGERGYLSSIIPSIETQADVMKMQAREVAKRYGLLGLPVQAFQGIMNPLTGTVFATKELKKALTGKYASLRREAKEGIVEALRG